MTKERVELNKFMCEKVFGKCWHELKEPECKWDVFVGCKKCNIDINIIFVNKIDYTSKEMFLTVWEELEKQDCLENFIFWYIRKYIEPVPVSIDDLVKLTIAEALKILKDLINSNRLCELIRDFLINREVGVTPQSNK